MTLLPSSSSDLEAWCRDRWAEKEARLHDFYSAQPRGFDRDGVAYVPPCKTELRVALIKAASLLYWSSFIALCLTGLWLWPPFRLYFVVMVGVYVAQQKLFGGLELLELSCHRYWKSMAADVGEKMEKMKWEMKTGLAGQWLFPLVLIKDTVELFWWALTGLEDPCQAAHTSCLIKGGTSPAGMLDFSRRNFTHLLKKAECYVYFYVLCMFLCAGVEHLITHSRLQYMYPSKVMFQLLVVHFSNLCLCLFWILLQNITVETFNACYTAFMSLVVEQSHSTDYLSVQVWAIFKHWTLAWWKFSLFFHHTFCVYLHIRLETEYIIFA